MVTRAEEMKMINLTQHKASPEQVLQGLRDVADRARLQQILTISEVALCASEDVLSSVLDRKVQALLTEFVLPEKAETVRRFMRSRANEDLSVFTDSEVLNMHQHAARVYVLVGGAPILMERLIPALRAIGAVPHHALSGRVVDEVLAEDGTTIKRSVFRHIRFLEAA